MKNLMNLGKILNKQEQKAINGGGYSCYKVIGCCTEYGPRCSDYQCQVFGGYPLC